MVNSPVTPILLRKSTHKTQSFDNAMVTEISFVSLSGGDILFWWIICYTLRPHSYWQVSNIIMMIEIFILNSVIADNLRNVLR